MTLTRWIPHSLIGNSSCRYSHSAGRGAFNGRTHIGMRVRLGFPRSFADSEGSCVLPGGPRNRGKVNDPSLRFRAAQVARCHRGCRGWCYRRSGRSGCEGAPRGETHSVRFHHLRCPSRRTSARPIGPNTPLLAPSPVARPKVWISCHLMRSAQREEGASPRPVRAANAAVWADQAGPAT